jgi:hypothetical protein
MKVLHVLASYLASSLDVFLLESSASILHDSTAELHILISTGSRELHRYLQKCPRKIKDKLVPVLNYLRTAHEDEWGSVFIVQRFPDLRT